MKDGYEIGDPSKEAKAEMEKFFVTYKDTIERPPAPRRRARPPDSWPTRSSRAARRSRSSRSSTRLQRRARPRHAGRRLRAGGGQEEGERARLRDGLYRDGSLPFTQGVRMRRDENGDLSLYAFAHYYERPTKRGVDKAKGLASLGASAFSAPSPRSRSRPHATPLVPTIPGREPRGGVRGAVRELRHVQPEPQCRCQVPRTPRHLDGTARGRSPDGCRARPEAARSGGCRNAITAAKDAVALKKRFNAAGSKGGGGVAAAEAAKAEAGKAKKGTIGPLAATVTAQAATTTISAAARARQVRPMLAALMGALVLSAPAHPGPHGSPRGFSNAPSLRGEAASGRNLYLGATAGGPHPRRARSPNGRAGTRLPASIRGR